MASGRYMETVGWVSANLTNVGKMKLSRRYLDNNRKTFKYHTGTLQGESFDTDTGLALSNELHETHRNLNLSVVLGHSPKNYFLSRYPATSDHSVLKKLMDDVLPGTVFNEEADADHFRLFVANSGSQRFDVFKGPFTVDDQFVTSPFVSRFVHFNVTARVGRQLVWKMNDEGATQFLPSDDTQRSYLSWVEDQSLRHYRTAERAQAAFNAEKDTDKSQYGYVTVDSCGDRGDDIDHLPSCKSRPQWALTFLQRRRTVNAVNKLDPSVELDYSSFKPYGDPKVQIKDVWGIYAKKFW
ncbi:hypothetical protein QFC19_009210 [Naganishia cerealis]|uniref:Uncharacterized protein n=1 Tax=Naganishia cerealis TaxID=610337 RepID=A0ACC2UWW2_9TREE|nr:hypothetical protein QFC19_009210 [Naganishia cerealis]